MLTPNPLIALLDPPTTSDEFHTLWVDYAWPVPHSYSERQRAQRLFPSFAAIVLAVTGETIVRCNDCGTVVLTDETGDYCGDPICQDCQENYDACDDCGCTVHNDDIRYLDGLDRSVCESCSEGYYWCEYCEAYSNEPCEACSVGCECHAPHQHFRFPANGAGTVQSDERLTVTLPKGVISEAGVFAITQAVTRSLPTATLLQQAQDRHHAAPLNDPAVSQLRDAWYAAIDEHDKACRNVRKAVESVGDEWQTKRGNYPKRLGSALHKLGTKLAPETISEVGNLARQYSDDTSEFHVEFTRDLNQSAAYFYHDASCWWQSYANSRCALKNWGGLAMRTFASEDSDQDDPSGRVFLFPLNEGLLPTQDAEKANAYMVFNAYGALGGYSSARIIAHLTGKTYRKVPFDLNIDNGYVNSSVGYLVASAETIASAPDAFTFSGDTHTAAP